jgi:hypothetical protein
MMTSPVFIERGSLSLGGGVATGERTPPSAEHALAKLRDAGYEVTIVEPPTDQAVIAGPTAGSWLVTSDPRHCERRPAGVRTILVGPRRPPGPRPTARCDVEARDLAAAVIEILTRDAMS